MAKGLNKEDFGNPEIWDYLSKNDYENALLNSQQKDLKPIIVNWLSKNVPTIDVDNETIVELVVNWYLHFKSINNVLFSFLKYLGKNNIKPTYNDLVVINNKYQEGILEDKDIYGGYMFNLLKNKDFYGKPYKDQGFLIDVYSYFSDRGNVNNILDNIPNTLGGNEPITTIEGENLTKSDLQKGSSLRNFLLFKGANPKGEVRSADSVEKGINRLAKYVSNDKMKPSENTTPKKKRSYVNYDKVYDFIQDNKNLFSDDTFRQDLLTWLSKEV